jgi:hypothetical protein
MTCPFRECHTSDDSFKSAPCQRDNHEKCGGYAIGPVVDGEGTMYDCDCCCHDLDKIATLDAIHDSMYK